jgi:RHS repeat-associated protein
MATLYASAYLVATPKGYTKHYYAGNDRIASKIGGGGLSDIKDPIGNWQEKQEHRHFYKRLWMDCLNSLEPEMNEEAMLYKLHDYTAVQDSEKELYFYHPDHLGSAAWVTDKDGKAIQHLQYLPFGEPRIDQRTASWNTMFTFSGKERDEESSYSYFGARYYDSDISIWLSVDPQASSYPGLTPYNYCMNSPVMLRDPNGEDVAFGAVIGGMFGFYQGLQIAIDKGLTGWEKFGYGMLGGLIGSSAGLLGGMAGSAVGGAVGTSSFAGGFVTAAVSATISTTISATSMAWMSGASFWQGMSSGFVQGQIAGLIGGTIGGIAGGINAKSHGGNFWTGKGAKYNMLGSSAGNSITIGEGMEYSNEYATNFSDTYFGKNVRGVDNLYANGTLPVDYELRGDAVFTPNGKETLGTTVSNGVGKGSNVYLYKAAFVCKEELYLVMGHEYIHAHFYNIGLMNKDAHHAAIYAWVAQQATAWGYKTEVYRPWLENSIKNASNIMPYTNLLPFSIWPVVPW